jgi:hypothetical protein
MLLGILAADLDAAQQFGRLVAPHRSDDHFQLARNRCHEFSLNLDFNFKGSRIGR